MLPTVQQNIYLPPLTNFPVNSVKDLIDSLYRTIGGEKRWYVRRTYLDEACLLPEPFYRRRSFEDLLCLARTYFPETTEVELMKVLHELNMNFIYCDYTRKIMFLGPEGYGYVGFNREKIKEHAEKARRYYYPTYKADDLLRIYDEAGL